MYARVRLVLGLQQARLVCQSQSHLQSKVAHCPLIHLQVWLQSNIAQLHRVKERLTGALLTTLLHCFSGGPWYMHVCTCVHIIISCVYTHTCIDTHVCHNISAITWKHASKCIGHDQTCKIYGCNDNCNQQLHAKKEPMCRGCIW